jgi:hypothetical protein
MSTFQPPPSGVHPGLVLVLGEPVARGPADEFLAAFRRRLGAHPSVAVLDWRDLVDGGFPPPHGSFMRRMRFERWMADRVDEVLAAAGAVRNARGRFLVTVVGLLSEAQSRRHAVEVLPYVHFAFPRINAAGLEPTLVGVTALPQRWSALQAAELFAWLKEFSGVLRANPHPGVPRYTLATLIGRARALDREEEEPKTDADVELARAAAEFAAACHTSALVDWVRGTERGRPGAPHFHSYGIMPLNEAEARVQAELSQVLWPVLRDLRPRSGRAVLRALVGGADFAEPYLEAWERIPTAPAGDRARAWLLRMAGGLDPADVVGAEEWRSRYLRMPADLRAALHGVPEAAGWPDPLAAPASRSTIDPEPAAL